MAELTVYPTEGPGGLVTGEPLWRKMARNWMPTGVVEGLAASIAGTTVTVQPGAIWIDGHYAELAAAETVDTGGINGLVLVSFDPNTSSAQLSYAATPVTNRTGIWEEPLAEVIGGVLTDKRIARNPRGDIQARSFEAQLSIAGIQTIPVAGYVPLGSITVPPRNPAVERTLYIGATSTPWNDSTVGSSACDFYIRCNGTNQNRSRWRHTINNQFSVTVDIIYNALANETVTIDTFFKPATAIQFSLHGGADLNWISAVEIPRF